jgi:Calcineurin-like phosphoesterase
VIEQTRVLAIGDVHGCAAALEALLGAVAPRAHDVVITLGDYVDCGIDSAGVIERLIRLSATCQLVPLRGNHEEMMTDARRGPELLDLWKQLGGDATLVSYAPEAEAPGLDRVPAEHWDFLDRTCRDLYETESHVFVHGGLGSVSKLLRPRWAGNGPDARRSDEATQAVRVVEERERRRRAISGPTRRDGGSLALILRHSSSTIRTA